MQKIVIRNFNQISSAEIDLAKFVCLIGEQASGKSTVAKLIYFFKSLKVEFLRLFFEETDITDSELRKRFISIISSKFSEYFGSIGQLNDEFELQFYISIEESHYIKLAKNENRALNISFSRRYWTLFSTKASALRKQLKNSIQSNISSYLLQTRVRQDLIQKIKLFVDQLFFDYQDTIFFPAGRSLITALSDKLKSYFDDDFFTNSAKGTIRRSIDFNLIKDYIGYTKTMESYFETYDSKTDDMLPYIMRHHIEKILKGHYYNEDGKERIYYDDLHFIPLNIASSGQQDAINIILDAITILKDNLQACRIIEEPETHLFPNAQRLLIEIFITLINGNENCSYIITTHSPFVIASLNNLLYLSKVLTCHPDKLEHTVESLGEVTYTKDMIACIRLSKDKFRAYNLDPSSLRYCTSMVDEETGLIGDNMIDKSSEAIYAIFDKIYDIDDGC